MAVSSAYNASCVEGGAACQKYKVQRGLSIKPLLGSSSSSCSCSSCCCCCDGGDGSIVIVLVVTVVLLCGMNTILMLQFITRFVAALRMKPRQTCWACHRSW